MDLHYGGGVSVKSERLEDVQDDHRNHHSAYCLSRNGVEPRRTSGSMEYARLRTQILHEKKQQAVQKLLLLVQANDFEKFKKQLESKPDLNVLINGQTVLHYCLLFGRDVSWCKLLVSSGANPNLSNLDGWHPIHLAAFNGLQETLTYLLSVNQYQAF